MALKQARWIWGISGEPGLVHQPHVSTAELAELYFSMRTDLPFPSVHSDPTSHLTGGLQHHLLGHLLRNGQVWFLGPGLKAVCL